MAAPLQRRTHQAPGPGERVPPLRPARRRARRLAAAAAAAEDGAVAAPAPAPPPPPRPFFRVFVGATGLIGTERLVRSLPAPLARLLCLHTVVMLETVEGGSNGGEEDEPGGRRRPRTKGDGRAPPPPLLLLDFVPERPTDPATGLALLTGGGVPGVARARMVPQVGVAQVVVALAEAAGGGGSADAAVAAGAAVAALPLRLLTNDCRTHTAAVLTAVLGRPVGRAEVARLLAAAADGGY